MANINLFDYINSQEIAAYVTERPENAVPYFAETLFPNAKQMGTDISWLKGANGLPIAIQPSDYDVKARLREHSGFEQVATEMAFFREATRIGEKDRQKLNMLLAHPDSTVALPIIQKIFDDIARLVEGVRVQAEIMRMQLLTTGKINVVSADGRTNYVYDYGQQNKYNASVAFGAANADADPIRDLIAACDDMELKCGVRPRRMVMNRKTFLDMIQCPKLHKMQYPDDSANNKFISEQEVQRFIEACTGLSIYVYSKKFAVLDHSTGLAHSTQEVNVVPDGVICLLPEGSLGKTWYGDTPEASDLIGGGTDAQVSVVNNGTTITTYKEKHPVQVVTVVSAVMIPSFERIDYCAIFNTQA